MIFVDTNYFIRLLIQDDVSNMEKASKLFLDAANGRVELQSSVVVFFEIYWLLKTFYGQKKSTLQDRLLRLLKLKVNWELNDLLAGAVKLMSKLNYDLEDAYHLVWAKASGVKEIASFDKKLLREWGKLSVLL